MNIPEHRKAIDKYDAQLIKLLNERTKHVLAIGEIKLKAGEEIYAPQPRTGGAGPDLPAQRRAGDR